jgi:hypothetical protein
VLIPRVTPPCRSTGARILYPRRSMARLQRKLTSMGLHAHCSNAHHPLESVAPRQAAITATQSYPSPTSSPSAPSCSNQSSPETSDEGCLTPPSGDDQVAIALPSTAHRSSMMNTDTTLKSKAISSTSHSVNPTDPSFAFTGPTVR